MTRFMIAGTHSGCGKTTVTCAILQALVDRGLSPRAFKCGPDYIDPMFHKSVIGVGSRNLDLFFCDKNTVEDILKKHGGNLSVIEGVMGFYDGVGEVKSSFELSEETDTPVVLVVDSKGMSQSLGAVIKGFLTFKEPNNIAGVIFNRLPERLEATARELCEKMGTRYLGYFPYKKELFIKSRNLGLEIAEETENLKEKTKALARLAEENILIDDILKMCKREDFGKEEGRKAVNYGEKKGGALKIALARDRAFCFYYEENLETLCDLGCEIEEFSPLEDKSLPEGASGLILGGGYPELYAKELSENTSLLSEIRKKIRDGLPTIAECGGFMYLCKSIGGERAVGVIDAEAYGTERLRRFGYINLHTPKESVFGEAKLKAHEFHYWEASDPGLTCVAERARDGERYLCAHTSETLYAGFPHLWLMSDIDAAKSFVKKCREYENART